MNELALLGGEKARVKAYPEWPVHDEREIEAVTRASRAGAGAASPIRGQKRLSSCGGSVRCTGLNMA